MSRIQQNSSTQIKGNVQKLNINLKQNTFIKSENPLEIDNKKISQYQACKPQFLKFQIMQER